GLCHAAPGCTLSRDPLLAAGGNDGSVCSSAYGDSELCLAGVCTPGVCRSQLDCVIITCLAYCSNNHFCGPCAYDTQCTGTTPFCDYIEPDGGIKGGHCVVDAGAPCANV